MAAGDDRYAPLPPQELLPFIGRLMDRHVSSRRCLTARREDAGTTSGCSGCPSCPALAWVRRSRSVLPEEKGKGVGESNNLQVRRNKAAALIAGRRLKTKPGNQLQDQPGARGVNGHRAAAWHGAASSELHCRPFLSPRTALHPSHGVISIMKEAKRA